MNKMILELIKNLNTNNDLKWVKCCTDSLPNFSYNLKYPLFEENNLFKIIDNDGNIITTLSIQNFFEIV